MINWFDMPSQGLSGGGEFEIKELTATENKVYETPGEVYNKVTVNIPQPTGKIKITENGTDINIAQYATADVNVEGGGGSSDFSTAEVTVINTIDYTGVIGYAPVCLEASEGELGEAYSFVEVITTARSTVINRIVLYKGRAVLTTNNELSSISGNIEALAGTVYLIKGDCTITIS